MDSGTGIPQQTAMDEWVGLFATRNELAEEYARIMRREGQAWKNWPTLNLAIEAKRG